MSSVLKIVVDPQRDGKSDYARIIEYFWTIDGPRSRLTDRTFPTYSEAKTTLTELKGNMPGLDGMDPHVEQILYRTKDPDNSLNGLPLPAMTTMLFRVCDNDQTKFEEALRLVSLFIEEAIRSDEPTDAQPG